jgi:hypothetical protein
MTADDLIPLLEQAGICQEVWFEHHRSIERLAALVAAHEREACAKVAENGLIGHTIAIAIRARGEQEQPR